MTSGTKVEFGTVRPNHPLSATNNCNCIDEVQLALNSTPLPKLCGQKSNVPSCVKLRKQP